MSTKSEKCDTISLSFAMRNNEQGLRRGRDVRNSRLFLSSEKKEIEGEDRRRTHQVFLLFAWRSACVVGGLTFLVVKPFFVVRKAFSYVVW